MRCDISTFAMSVLMTCDWADPIGRYMGTDPLKVLKHQVSRGANERESFTYDVAILSF